MTLLLDYSGNPNKRGGGAFFTLHLTIHAAFRECVCVREYWLHCDNVMDDAVRVIVVFIPSPTPRTIFYSRNATIQFNRQSLPLIDYLI